MNTDEISSIKKIMDEFIDQIRPSEEIRSKIDIGYKIEAPSVFILEIMPQWDNPTIIRQFPLAKATFVKTKNLWKIFWKIGNGSWFAYSPKPEVNTLQAFNEIVKKDEHYCFWG